MLTVALLSSTNRAIMQTDLNAHRSLIGSFLRVWHLVSAVAAVAELASGHALSYSPLRELAADSIRDRRKCPLTYEDLAAESSTSAVTVAGREAISIGT
jgi:hypothetical protein